MKNKHTPCHHNLPLENKITPLHPCILVTARHNLKCHMKKEHKPCHHHHLSIFSTALYISYGLRCHMKNKHKPRHHYLSYLLENKITLLLFCKSRFARNKITLWIGWSCTNETVQISYTCVSISECSWFWDCSFCETQRFTDQKLSSTIFTCCPSVPHRWHQHLCQYI